MQVKTALEDLSILIINNDAAFAHKLRYETALATYRTTFAATPVEAAQFFQSTAPDVIIVCAEHFRMEEIPLPFDDAERPILIVVTDHPSSELFAIADQVVPISYLPFIEDIIRSQNNRSQWRNGLEKHQSILADANRQLSQQLDLANRTKAEINILKQAIVHSVSHELRTPMLQVKSAVALLNEDENTNRNIIELATEATTRLEGGIRNVTLLNELMNENSSAESFTAVPLIQIIQAALRNLGRSWEHKKNVERVQIISSEQPYAVLCDKQRLTIAVQLLIDNALKFSQDTVEVEMIRVEGNVRVSIQDRGIGIPSDQLERIFEPFYQIDGSSTRRFGGMGIGLAIVQLILEQHHTSIQIDSTQGKGSTFSFDLASVDA
jgi:signal transduction histidine kinase